MSRVRLETLFLKYIRKGPLRLHEYSVDIIPAGADCDQGHRPVYAFIRGRSARTEGSVIGAFDLHAGLSRSQSRCMLLEGGRGGSGGLSGARGGVREVVETGALLCGDRFGLCDLRAENLKLRNELGGSVSPGPERWRGGAGHLVELGDTTRRILVANPRTP